MKYETDPIKKWKRLNFDESKLPPLDKVRERSEIETDRDLAKPIEQLLCDVHEEIHNNSGDQLGNIACAQKRMVSMMAKVAISNNRVGNLMLLLTIVITALTIAIFVLTYLMWKNQ
jgi:hypothetical protein